MDHPESSTKLTDFLDPSTLQELQDSFATVARVSVVIEAPDGAVITRPSGRRAADGAGHEAAVEVDGQVLARIVLGSQADQALEPEVIEFGNVLAGVLARLCTEESQLRRRVDELSAVYDVASLLAGTHDVQRILEQTAETVCNVMKVDACSIRLLADDLDTLDIRAVHNLSDDYLNKGPVTQSENPIDAEALTGRNVYVADAPSDKRTRYPAQARAEGIVSALAVGMLCLGRPVGVIRAYTRQQHRFSPFEVSLLRALAAQSAAAIVNARLYREAREADRWTRQIQYAGDIQRRMIPARPPERPGIDLGTAYAPSLEVGGDFYDFIELPSGHIGLAIADVVGKGLPAALMMASLRSALRVYARTLDDIDEVMANVNDHFHRDTLVSEFATAVYGLISPDGRTFVYCNAGHNPPVLLRDRTVHTLETGGMVLGVRPGERFDKEVVPLRPGDVLLFYTDGVLDATNFAGENFGYERMIRSLVAKIEMPAPLIARDVLFDVRRFVGLAPQADDLTLVAMKVI